MNVAERRHAEFHRITKRANIYAGYARTSDASGAATPYIRRYELAPTTALRTQAQGKYPQRFPVAYGGHRSRAGARRRSSTAKFHPPRTDRPLDAEFPVNITTSAETTNSLHQVLPSLRDASPSSPDSAALRYVGRQADHRKAYPHPRIASLRQAIDLTGPSDRFSAGIGDRPRRNMQPRMPNRQHWPPTRTNRRTEELNHGSCTVTSATFPHHHPNPSRRIDPEEHRHGTWRWHTKKCGSCFSSRATTLT